MPRAPNPPPPHRKRGSPGKPLACLAPPAMPGFIPLATYLALVQYAPPPPVPVQDTASPPTALIPKIYAPSDVPHLPLRIHHALLLIGLPRARVYADRNGLDAPTRRHGSPRRTTGFWEQSREVLEALAMDMRTIYHAHLRQVHPDLGGTHEAAAQLVGAFTRARTLFRQHGVSV